MYKIPSISGRTLVCETSGKKKTCIPRFHKAQGLHNLWSMKLVPVLLLFYMCLTLGLWNFSWVLFQTHLGVYETSAMWTLPYSTHHTHCIRIRLTLLKHICKINISSIGLQKWLNKFCSFYWLLFGAMSFWNNLSGFAH